MNVYTCIERLSLVQRKIKNAFRQKKDGIIAESWKISVHKDGESTISGTDKTFARFLKENNNAVEIVVASLDNDAGIYGTVALSMNR